jgi:hypothetical protein
LVYKDYIGGVDMRNSRGTGNTGAVATPQASTTGATSRPIVTFGPGIVRPSTADMIAAMRARLFYNPDEDEDKENLYPPRDNTRVR